MNASYTLSAAEIDKQITRTSEGNYALGHVNDKAVFLVNYVGRSDTDLNARLKKWVGKYESFKYAYATSPKAAFEKECRNFHDFGGTVSLDNDIHPDRPASSGWKCPACSHFD